MAIAKVILNGDTLMDVTQKTVTAGTMKSGITALKNDGTDIIGTYTPNLQAKNVVAPDTESLIAPGGDMAIFITRTNAPYSHTTITVSGTVSSLKTIDSSKNYKIYGQIIITDSTNNIIERISIDNSLQYISNSQYCTVKSNDYVAQLWVEKFNSNVVVYCTYKPGDFGWKEVLAIVEVEDEYEGLAPIIVSPPQYLSIYKAIATRENRLDYSQQIVQDYCNSLSVIRKNQFRGNIFQPYSQGSITFSQVSYIYEFGFAGSNDTGYNGYGTAYNYNLYFPMVSAIAQWAFTRQEDLNSIEMPLLSFIPSYAFYQCKMLSSISFSNCSMIGSYAFGLCTSLTNVYFPSCISISNSAFYSCHNLLTADFPMCTTINREAFCNCSKLNTISFPECIQISTYAFCSCSALTAIEFPECLSIGSYAFAKCTSITTASFPKCTYMESSAFQYCSNLISVYMPECSSIGYCAFISCSNLSDITFTKCEYISGSGFYSCYNLSSANFPSCTTIGQQAFALCSNLTNISFPICTTIGSSAFLSCSNLTTAIFPSCTIIYNSCFAQCNNLTTVELPMCSIIYPGAFSNCQNLSTLSLPQCTMINAYAFYSCCRLLSLYLMNFSYVTLSNVAAFASTPISTYTTYTNGVNGSIYVPSSMLSTYQTMTNWATYSSRFVGI